MLDYRIETFLTLCREKNYSKTAQELCITQPAVTQHIQYLERLYNTKLFEYQNKQLTLTEQGKLLERMALGLSASDKRVMQLIQESMLKRRHLKIGASLSLSECIMPIIIADLLQHLPDLQISITVDSEGALLDGLKSGLYECLFVEGSFNKEEYEHRLFSVEDFIAVSGRPLEPNSLSDLLKETLICRGTESRPQKILEDVLLSNNISVNEFYNTISVNNLNVIKELLKQGVGIAFMYKAAVINELNAKTLYEIPLDLHIKKEFNFVILKNNIFSNDYLKLYERAKEIYTETNPKNYM